MISTIMVVTRANFLKKRAALSWVYPVTAVLEKLPNWSKRKTKAKATIPMMAMVLRLRRSANDSIKSRAKPRPKTISSRNIGDIKSFPKQGHAGFDFLQHGLWHKAEEEQTSQEQ